MGGMPELPPSLVELARRFGIATEYEDWTGRLVPVPAETLVAVLAALGVEAGTEQDRNAALTARRRAYWQRRMPATIVGALAGVCAHARRGATASATEDIRTDRRVISIMSFSCATGRPLLASHRSKPAAASSPDTGDRPAEAGKEGHPSAELIVRAVATTRSASADMR